MQQEASGQAYAVNLLYKYFTNILQKVQSKKDIGSLSNSMAIILGWNLHNWHEEARSLYEQTKEQVTLAGTTATIIKIIGCPLV